MDGKKLLINVLWFATGAAVGGLASYYYVKKAVEKGYFEDFEQAVEEEVQHMRSWLSDKRQESIDSIKTEPVLTDDEDISEDSETSYLDYTKAASVYQPQVAKEPLEEIIKRKSWVDEEGPDGDAIAEDEEPSPAVFAPTVESDEPIHLITSDDFYNDKEDYEKLNLSYYEGDNTLTDDKNEIIPDIYSIVTPEILTSPDISYGGYIGYVRNNKLHADFEIEFFEGSYVELVLGYKGITDEPKRIKRRGLDGES